MKNLGKEHFWDNLLSLTTFAIMYCINLKKQLESWYGIGNCENSDKFGKQGLVQH